MSDPDIYRRGCSARAKDVARIVIPGNARTRSIFHLVANIVLSIEITMAGDLSVQRVLRFHRPYHMVYVGASRHINVGIVSENHPAR